MLLFVFLLPAIQVTFLICPPKTAFPPCSTLDWLFLGGLLLRLHWTRPKKSRGGAFEPGVNVL